MSLHGTSGDISRLIASYMDRQSLQTMAQVWPSMRDVGTGPHGSGPKYLIEVEQFGMVEGDMPPAHRGKTARELRTLLYSYISGLTLLKPNRFNVYSFSNSDPKTTFNDDIYLSHNSASFMGQSGGCIYHVHNHDENSQHRHVVEIIRPPSLRAGIETLKNIKPSFPFPVRAFAVEPNSALTAALETHDYGFVIHITHPWRTDFRERTIAVRARWHASSVRTTQFEISGNFVACHFIFVPLKGDQRQLKRTPFSIWDWTTGGIVYRNIRAESIQFTSENSFLVMSYGHRQPVGAGETLHLELAHVTLSQYGPMPRSLLPLDITAEHKIRSVSFIPQVTRPTKAVHDPLDEFVTGVSDPPPNNGPFHADPRKGIVGIYIDHSPPHLPFCLLYDRKEFFVDHGPVRSEHRVDGAQPFINGTRILWWNPMRGNIRQKDFNVNAISLRFFGAGVRDSPHIADPNWRSTAVRMVQHPNAPFGSSSFESEASRHGHWGREQFRHMYATEDNVVVLQTSPENKVEAQVFTF